MYAILHAFSRRNAGDGLLVDLTLEALKDAGVDSRECVLIALDATSFSDLNNVHQGPGEFRGTLSLKAIKSVAALFENYLLSSSGWGLSGETARIINEAKGLVAVGGGYLVADSPVRNAGILVNHLLQARLAARSPAPSIYLPQSIGPFSGPARGPLFKALSKIDRIYARDDKTFKELPFGNKVRCPDLAVLKLARELDAIEPASKAGQQFVIVPRDLPNPLGLDEGLKSLSRSFPGALWAVQAEVSGKRSDRAFIQSLGEAPAGNLDAILNQGRAGIAISVRLHGSLGALLKGVPSIHLAYERKGWGAYEDLGLSEFVHDARNFDPILVAEQARRIFSDPADFWTRVKEKTPQIKQSYQALLTDLSERFSLSKR